MNNRRELIAGLALLTMAFLGHSIVLIVFEPAMGFREFSDFFDLEKIVPALGSTAWYVSNVMHVLVGLGLLLFATGVQSSGIPRPFLIVAFGIAAAPLFVMLGMSGFVGDQLVALLTDIGERDAALLGLIVGARTMVLYAGVALFGGMVLVISVQAGFVPRWLRVLGVPVGTAALAFVVIPTPIPLIFFIWSAAMLISISMDSDKHSHASRS